LVGGVARPPSLGKLLKAVPKELYDLGEQAGERVVFLKVGVSLEKRVRGVAQCAKRISEGQGEEAGRLLEGFLGYGTAEAVRSPAKKRRSP
jgi:hypothetical protein